MSEDLKRQAQEKLVAAWDLIKEAGALAKKGQFYLHFGEVGEFVPSSFGDRDALRAEALETLKREGRDNGGKWVSSPTEKYPNGQPKQSYVSNPSTPYDELSEEEVEDEVERIIDSIIDNGEISSDAREYAERDQWWHPSRC